MAFARHAQARMYRHVFFAAVAGSLSFSALLSSAAAGPRPGDPVKMAQLLRPASKLPDHEEFDAMLEAPFVSTAASGARDFKLRFDYPGIAAPHVVGWELTISDARHRVVRRWSGETALSGQPAVAAVHWGGRADATAPLADGLYTVTLRTGALDAARLPASATGAARVQAVLSSAAASVTTQSWDVLLGALRPQAMPAFHPLPHGRAQHGGLQAYSVPANAVPYTIYYGNLHSQTNDSDGGGDVSTCHDAQAPQTGAYGPSDAYAYAKAAGLDILMTSEHNHLYDGSTGTNTSGSTSAAISRYHTGLNTAASFNAAHPDFLAVYGMEWGVISNGGHMNIFNSNQLLGWEYDSSGQLFADLYTAKSDYAAIYATMRQNGLIGQFNHPDTSGQFTVNGTSLGYSADGDQVMVLAEVMNSSAFSSNTSETETGMSKYEAAFNILLERGYHVAPSSDQDNHCANWGRSYSNRTGVLIPNGTALTMQSFLDALKARHVFATMDKTAQLVLTANGHLMGDRFANSGPLTLTAGYASSSGRSVASVQILEGVPGSNGSVSTAASSGSVTLTPADGEHFYYAKVTQDDGKVLWSAPVWVTQGSGTGGDTTPPTVSAAESGTAGSITLSATASDDVGVTKVDFLIDGSLKGSVSSAPYAMSFDSTGLANGSHTLTAKAYDAAGNAGTSSPVSFSISNAGSAMTETEPNGSLSGANLVGSATTITGTMGNTTDKDYFKLTLSAYQTLKVDMTGPAGKDYDLYLVDGSGNVLDASEGTTCSESVSYKAGSGGKTVYIKVVSYSGSSTSQPYTLTISHP